ncbi:hypothetical protein PFISCL1PPCAC_24523, partial [Pristionchus fissidentatus]
SSPSPHLLSSSLHFIFFPMLWLVAPSVVAASALLATGCAKGRDDVKKPKSSGSNRSGPGSNKQKQSGKSSRVQGSSSKSSRRDPNKTKSGGPASGAAKKSSRSKREGGSSKSGKSAGRTSKSGKPPLAPKKDGVKAGAVAVKKSSKPGEKSTSSKRESKKNKPKDKSVEGSKREKSTKDKSKRSSKSKRSKRSSKSSRSKKSKKEVLQVDKTQEMSSEDAGPKNPKSALSPKAVNVTKLELAPVEGVATHEVRIEPSELRWKSTGGIQHVAVYNHSNVKKAVKVKCSDNLLYRVNPVHAFIPAGGSVRVDILRQNGTAKVDKIVIIAADAGKDDSVPRDVLNRSKAVNTDMMVLPLIVSAAN